MDSLRSRTLVFYVNGRKVSVERPDPAVTLVHFLRNTLELKGVKSGCQEGGCGSCTVMISKYCHSTKQISHYTAVSCITSICAMHGLAVTTIEALASAVTTLHPVQERLAKAHGSQCGFCSPGMVMSMYTLLRTNPRPSRYDIEQALEGNLCRCTGYRPILAGFNSFSEESTCSLGEDCCKNKDDGGRLKKANVSGLDSSGEYLPYDPSQEPIFPSELQLSDTYDKQLLEFEGERVTWFRPVTIQEALDLKDKYPEAKFIGGGTGFEGLWKQLKSFGDKITVIATTGISELKYINRNAESLSVGSTVTLSNLMKELTLCISNMPKTRSQYLMAFLDLLNVFASSQIRNNATIGGTVSDSEDFKSILNASGTKIIYARIGNAEEGRCQLVHGLKIPFSAENEFCRTFKVADRRHFGTSIVTSTFKVLFKQDTDEVEDFSSCFTSYSLPVFEAASTATAIIGKIWNDKLINGIVSSLHKEATEKWASGERSQAARYEYQVALVSSLLFKFYLSVLEERNARVNDTENTPQHMLFREPSVGTQVFEEVSATQAESDALGRPIVHLSGLQQVTGEAVYIDDMPQFTNELNVAFVTSKYAHAHILNLDMREAETMAGVKACISHNDVPGSNRLGVIFPDEEVFATDKVHHQGQIIAAVVADTYENAIRAAAAVDVGYRELKPIVTIEEAIAEESFLKPVSSKSLLNGDLEAGLAEADHVVEGEVYCGAQEHMALETAATICVPTGEKNEMTVYSNTQHPSGIQDCLVKALAVSANKIVVKVKRAGGSFGGKEIRNWLTCVPAAVAAMKLNKPLRCVLSRQTETLVKGTKHPILAKYKVGVSNDGHLTALDINLYLNCGYSNDVSLAVVDLAMIRVDGGYNIPNIRITSHLCKTNLHSATAYRGFGGPQAVFIIESVISHVSTELQIPREKLASLNLYKDGDVTPYDVTLANCTIRRCWEECQQNSDYQSRLQEVKQFNSKNRWKKKGIAMTPGKFAAIFGARVLNQAGALVHIYTDGSVLVSHGGVEMGQGLHTKIIQIASRVLGINVDKIYIMDTSTDQVPNCTPTAGSLGTDLFGAAVMNACRTLNERLQPYMENERDGCWEKWVLAAFNDQVSLSATGFYKIECDKYDWQTFKGTEYWYYTYGAACTEVLIDCLTGEHVVLQTDIVMDVGKSLNPAIDIGQIEGAFLQGYGSLTMEEMRYSDKGEVLTLGPNTYKIPCVQDVPVRLNVALLKGSQNPRAVYSSKAIGEPPFILATSVISAIRDAIMAARQETGLKGHFRLDAPATPEKIRLSCPSNIV